MALVAHVASYGNPQPSSFIPCMLALSEALEKRGDQLALVSLNIPNATWIPHVRRSVAQLHLISNKAELYATIGQLQPSIIHTHFDDFDLPAVVRTFWSNVRIFWHSHTLRQGGTASALKFNLKYLALGKRVEAFVACSETVAADLHSWGAPDNKIKVVLNGIDLTRFRPPSPEERHAAREQFDLGEESVLLFFGRDIYIKGVDTFVDTLKLLDKPTVMLIGAPPEANEQAAQSSGRLISIESVADVRQLYWAADLLVVASRYEGLPQVLMEAVACGLPAVAGDIGAVREISRDLDEVRLVAANDPRSLALGIGAQKKDLRLERNPRLQKFSLGRWVNDILALYYGGQV